MILALRLSANKGRFLGPFQLTPTLRKRVQSVVMARRNNYESDAARSAGSPPNALKLSVNIQSEVGSQLRRIAFEQQVSESSIIEIALRQLFLRVSKEAIGPFLRQNGACLRRRS